MKGEYVSHVDIRGRGSHFIRKAMSTTDKFIPLLSEVEKNISHLYHDPLDAIMVNQMTVLVNLIISAYSV